MIIGLDIGGTNIRAGLVHNGKIVKCVRLPTCANIGPDKSLEQIKRTVQSLLKKASATASAIGIGVAGIIDSDQGIVRYSPNFKGWCNIGLARILAKEFKKPVKVINDVNAILLGEWKYGAAKGYRNVFLFTLGTGVGGAAVCEGNLVFGSCGFAGEFGHMTIKYNGAKCVCGNKGCLERYVGARYIVAKAKALARKTRSVLWKYNKLTPKIIAREARNGDETARQILTKIGYLIGVGVSNIINLLDPQIVVISGGIARAGGILFRPIRKAAHQRVVGSEYRRYEIVPGKLSDNAGILGAAYFASQKSLRR